MNSSHKTHLFFDLDGTLINSFQGITNCVCYALEYLGIQVENKRDLLPFIGPPLTYSFREYYHLSDEHIAIAVAKYRERYAVKGVYENQLYDGIKPLLADLCKCGYRLCLATSKPLLFAGQILDYFNIAAYFTYVGGSDFEGAIQSKYDVVRKLLADNNISPDRVWMIGDRKYDVEGAGQAGVDTIGVLYGFGSMEELQQYGCKVIVENVDELRSFLIKM